MIESSNARIITGLSAVCILGVAGLGLFCRSDRLAPVGAVRSADAALVLDAMSVTGSDRIACTREAASAQRPAPIEEPVAAATRGRCETEAQYRARFLVDATHEEGGLESVARRVLSGNGPDCEKVAVLRALCDSGSPHAVEFLATAVTDFPDVSSAKGESVPRCALRFLADRAGQDAHVRATLMRLVWSGDKSVAAGLRASAAATVAFVASGAEAWQIVRWLQLERDPLVHASAFEALSRNRDPDAVLACRSLGADLPTELARDD